MNNEVVVVDANIAIKWVLIEADSELARALLAEWKKKEMIVYVPTLLSYEVTNILYREVRAGRITTETAIDGINMIHHVVSPVYSRNAVLNLRAMAMAKHFDLSAAYDSHYLALAEHVGCEFWTADTKMWKVVKDQFDWVHWIGDYPAP
jgi:predicted nucleic acid-binding protein